MSKNNEWHCNQPHNYTTPQHTYRHTHTKDVIRRKMCACVCVGVSFRHRDLNRKNRESKRERGGWLSRVNSSRSSHSTFTSYLSLSLISCISPFKHFVCVSMPKPIHKCCCLPASQPACLLVRTVTLHCR